MVGSANEQKHAPYTDKAQKLKAVISYLLLIHRIAFHFFEKEKSRRNKEKRNGYTANSALYQGIYHSKDILI
jgi:hypothetical protein